MSDTPELLVHIAHGVQWLTLNRPSRRNALSRSLYADLLAQLQAAASDPQVAVVVLTGAGTAFCAGGDVARMQGAPQLDSTSQTEPATPAARADAMRARTRIVELLHEMPKPTIAMMRGASVGAGLSLALACHLRYADETAFMRTGFINAGVSGDFGVHYFLPRLVGAAKARELMLTSPRIPANEALALGLVHALFSPEDLAPAVTRVAQSLAAGPQPATAHMLRNIADGMHLSLARVLDQECIRHVACTDSADHAEAVRAFMEKRRPVFTSHSTQGVQAPTVPSQNKESA